MRRQTKIGAGAPSGSIGIQTPGFEKLFFVVREARQTFIMWLRENVFVGVPRPLGLDFREVGILQKRAARSRFSRFRLGVFTSFAASRP